MLQTTQEPSLKRVATTKICKSHWYSTSAKSQNSLSSETPNSVNMKEFINFYDKAFYAYWQSIHRMLKAVVYDVNCTSDANKVLFNVILNFTECIIMSSSLNTAKVSVELSTQNPINSSLSFV